MAVTTKKANGRVINKCLSLVREMTKLKTSSLWMDYDREADVLYVSFRKPQHATKTIEGDNDILIRKDGRNIVGLTILNASTR